MYQLEDLPLLPERMGLRQPMVSRLNAATVTPMCLGDYDHINVYFLQEYVLRQLSIVEVNLAQPSLGFTLKVILYTKLLLLSLICLFPLAE